MEPEQRSKDIPMAGGKLSIGQLPFTEIILPSEIRYYPLSLLRGKELHIRWKRQDRHET